MPTFNTNQDSLAADINGTYEGLTPDNAFTNDDDKADRYSDYVSYAVGDKRYGYELWDGDLTDVDELENADLAALIALDTAAGGSEADFQTLVAPYVTAAGAGTYTDFLAQVTGKTEHTAAMTRTATVISMADWQAKTAAEKATFYGWVYDTDGWAYWSQPIEPKVVDPITGMVTSQNTTGLLLDAINPRIDDSYYYQIHVIAQFVTANDLGQTDGTGFFAAGKGTDPSPDALDLLNTIGVNITGGNTLAVSTAATSVERGGTATFSVADTSGNPVTNVTWIVNGSAVSAATRSAATVAETTMSDMTLSVATNETANKLTVIAIATKTTEDSDGNVTATNTLLGSYDIRVVDEGAGSGSDSGGSSGGSSEEKVAYALYKNDTAVEPPEDDEYDYVLTRAEGDEDAYAFYVPEGDNAAWSIQLSPGMDEPYEDYTGSDVTITTDGTLHLETGATGYFKFTATKASGETVSTTVNVKKSWLWMDITLNSEYVDLYEDIFASPADQTYDIELSQDISVSWTAKKWDDDSSEWITTDQISVADGKLTIKAQAVGSFDVIATPIDGYENYYATASESITVQVNVPSAYVTFENGSQNYTDVYNTSSRSWTNGVPNLFSYKVSNQPLYIKIELKTGPEAEATTIPVTCSEVEVPVGFTYQFTSEVKDNVCVVTLPAGYVDDGNPRGFEVTVTPAEGYAGVYESVSYSFNSY